MALIYSPPSITVNQTGAQTILSAGPTGKVIVMVGTAPMGPDYPVLIDPTQAIGLYGDPSNPNTNGYTLPLAMRIAAGQTNPARSSGIQFLVCRVGVTRGTKVLNDVGAAAVVTLQAIGKYAGSRATNLQVEVTGAGPTLAITFYDSVSGQQLQTYPASLYNVATAAGIVQAINGSNPLNNPGSIVQATAGASANPPTALTKVAFAAGTDGAGTASTDPSIATALSNSLWTYADYVWAGWDAGAVGGAAGPIMAHINAAVAGNNFRKAILGPAAGTTYALLSGGSYGLAQSGRMVCMAHDSVYVTSPMTGIQTAVDGFYLAAAYAGMKAMGPSEETCTGFPLQGFQGIAIAPGLTGALSQAQMNSLASQGLLVLETPMGQTGVYVRDAITTAPLNLNGAVNPFSQFNIQDIDDQVAIALVNAVYPFKGRPGASADIQINQLQQACSNALAQLGQTINGINSILCTYDPTTMIPTVSVSYITRYPLLQIIINTSYTFS